MLVAGGATAEVGLALEESDAMARVRKCAAGRQAAEAAADDGNAGLRRSGHVSRLNIPRASTPSFSMVVRRTRSV